MTILPDKLTRDSLLIDTVERGIVFALLLLRNACTSKGKDYSYYNAIRIATNVRPSGNTFQSVINATAKIPYHSNAALLSGMDLLKNLKDLTDLTIAPNFNPLTPTANAPTLPDEQLFVNTLEKYLLFYSQILAAAVLPVVDRVKISFLEEDPKEPTLSIEYSLPIDWRKYLLTNNLIEATKLINTRSIDISDPETPIILMGNNGNLGNLSFLGN